VKLKSDFVTNSSSTAFVVLIPTTFHIDAGDIKILWDSVDPEEDLSVEQIHKETLEIIEKLKDGGDIWYYGLDGVHPQIYHTVLQICEDNKFIVLGKDLNGEGNNMIAGIKEETVNNIIINSININKTFNFLQKEKDDVKEK
jgi:hypothetical protein